MSDKAKQYPAGSEIAHLDTANLARVYTVSADEAETGSATLLTAGQDV